MKKKKAIKYRVKDLTEHVKLEQIANITTHVLRDLCIGEDIRDSVWKASVRTNEVRDLWFLYRFQYFHVNLCFTDKAFKRYSAQRRKNHMADMQKSG